MARILTGIQSTGVPHLGNLLGAILPAIEMSNKGDNEAFLFIANLHTLTTIRDAQTILDHTQATAAVWLACGLDTKKAVFYRQSDVTEVAELSWYLSCFMPYSRLQLAHSFKDKAEKTEHVSAGLFTYPVLMAADILLYDAEVVPVGKDQKQHLEFTRDVASSINHLYGEDTLVIPETKLKEDTMSVPGVDGQKMSKSYGNTINIFQPDKRLRKQVMGILTDSTPLEEPKNPDTCTVFELYSMLGSDAQIAEMRNNYLGGNYGYGHAKQALYEVIIDKFAKEREQFNYYMDNPNEVDKALLEGAEKAKAVANTVLNRIRKKLGYMN